MTAPQMFTIGGNFYIFDQDASGDYLSVTGNGQTIPINPYQFSLDGAIYIINTNVQPYTVVGGGNTYTMTAGNTQFVIGGVQYTITLKAGSLNGATISGQFNIAQANVVVLENYVYELDVQNGQIVGNGIGLSADQLRASPIRSRRRTRAIRSRRRPTRRPSPSAASSTRSTTRPSSATV